MGRHLVYLKRHRRPRHVNADWYRQSGHFIHFFARRPDGGGQTVWRVPATEVERVVDREPR